MADLKISQLTGATVPLAGTEVLPVVQSGITRKVAVSDLTSGRAVTTGALNVRGTQQLYDGNIWLVLNSDNTNYYYVTNTGATGAGNAALEMVLGGVGTALKLDGSRNVNLTAGNLIQGTAAKGINFTANTPAAGMTSQLLNWYEEGTWTPTVTAASGTITTVTAAGNYTRVGRQVTVNMNIVITTNGTGAAALLITGMPFNAATTRYDAGVGREYEMTGNAVAMTFSATNTLQMLTYNNTYPGGTGYKIAASITYNV